MLWPGHEGTQPGAFVINVARGIREEPSARFVLGLQ
jgi:hypothetical protein